MVSIQLTARSKNLAKASFWNEEFDVSLNPRQQIRAATPEWCRFLRSIAFEPVEIETIAIHQGAIDGSAERATVALNIRRFKEMIAGKRYPTADTVWKLAAYMRGSGIPWASEPLLLYASGHLSEFVFAIVEIERKKLIDRSKLLELIEKIDLAIYEENYERYEWEPVAAAIGICQLPSDGKNRIGQSADYEIKICNVVAKHFELGILIQRRAIIHHIIAWLRGDGKRTGKA